MSKASQQHTLTDMGGLCLAMMHERVQKMTAYLQPDLTVKVTRIGKAGGKPKRGDFRLTVGRPNFRERIFIKALLKAGEPFPVKKVQLKYHVKK